MDMKQTKSINSSHSSMARMINQPSLITHKRLKFLVFDAPSDRNLDLYLKELKSHHVTDVVRVCDPSYDKTALEKEGITVHDWPFPDGDPPPTQIVNDFLSLVKTRFSSPSDKSSPASSASNPSCCIGVHCVAGLGRAPVLVAMALIESGMAPLDAAIFIRERRRGAINAKQLKYLESYKPKGKEKQCTIQ